MHLFGFKFFLGDDRYFIKDVYVGLSFSLVLLFSSGFDRLFKYFSFVTVFIRGAAKRTYSLYLYHAPLLAMFAALTAHEPHRTGNLVTVIGLTLVSVFILSQATEQQRPKLRAWVSGWLKISPRVATRAG
jgi:peptidoglycan/LPS O-acetylase OafA/YrhL